MFDTVKIERIVMLRTLFAFFGTRLSPLLCTLMISAAITPQQVAFVCHVAVRVKIPCVLSRCFGMWDTDDVPLGSAWLSSLLDAAAARKIPKLLDLLENEYWVSTLGDLRAMANLPLQVARCSVHVCVQ